MPKPRGHARMTHQPPHHSQILSAKKEAKMTPVRITKNSTNVMPARTLITAF